LRKVIKKNKTHFVMHHYHNWTFHMIMVW